MIYRYVDDEGQPISRREAARQGRSVAPPPASQPETPVEATGGLLQATAPVGLLPGDAGTEEPR